MAPRIPKPYVDSSLKLEKTMFAELKNPDEFLKFLKKQQIKGKMIKIKGEVVQPTEDLPQPEKTVFIGLREVFKNVKRDNLGAVILDESVANPSTALHFFALIAKARKTCSFYVFKGLSKKASKLLDIGQVSAVGIQKNHPFLECLTKGSAEANSTKSEKVGFKKPTFTVPVGKKNKSKKKSAKAVNKKKN